MATRSSPGQNDLAGGLIEQGSNMRELVCMAHAVLDRVGELLW
ncbi:MAG: hypothetical protein P8J17_02260 [Halioglobus sp.]|nr:hypothetical protein [Halioglobus sp.]